MPLDSKYGAVNSLKLHQQILAVSGEVDLSIIDMVRPRDALCKGQVVRSYFQAGNSYALPFSLNYDAYSGSWLDHLKFTVSYLLFIVNSPPFVQRVKGIAPDIIHLNSLVLVSLVPFLKGIKELEHTVFISHVRELLRLNLSPTEIEMIKMLDGYVCIDTSTKERLLAATQHTIAPEKITVISNPFFAPNCYIGKPIPHLNPNNFIFAIVGKIAPDKGVIFVCEAFLSAMIPKAQLVIVGSGQGQYFQQFLHLVGKYPEELIYVGEIANLAEIGFYRLVDCVVRGDETFRTGRTVFEGLYAGTTAIVVGDQGDLARDQHLAQFKEQVFFYPPRNREALITVFQSAGQHKPVRDNLITDNFSVYREHMLNYYKIHSLSRITRQL